FPFNTQDVGVFFASCQTKTKSTCRALSYMLDEIKKIRENLVTEEELNTAKDAYINNFVFRFTTTEQIVGLLMGLEYDKRPADYYKNYLDNLRKVYAKDILKVAQQYLHPEALTIYVVGHKADFDESLEELGKVTEIALVPPQVD
ncbi:MAG: M16 family metallopeptidase, partial [Thermodesulfobacteriota bacterium]